MGNRRDIVDDRERIKYWMVAGWKRVSFAIQHNFDAAHLTGVEHYRPRIPMCLLLDVNNGFWRAHTCDDNVALLLEFQNKGKSEWRIASKDDCCTIRIIRNKRMMIYSPTTCRRSVLEVWTRFALDTPK